jgi:NADPH2:quinone reductase
MQSWWMEMTDTTTTLELRDSPQPTPGPKQLLVKVHAAGLNRGEFLLGHGLHGKAGTWKAIGGEGAGEVVAVGAEVQGFGPATA